jgi:hypothetical protein
MARGWESKSVEDQIDTAQAERHERQRAVVTMQERERQTRKQSLLLSRSRTVSLLKAAHNERYRKQLELALQHLDAQLHELG